jgi:arabinofuranan 3-O-arabinosyltransferase
VIEVVLLALLAYLPGLRSSPGKIPGDTKLFLYLDPGRLVSDAIWSWDSRQFGGWVPHQTLSYLWPQGPWYWTLQHLGVPDWVAQRLWVGTILLVAGLGARWLARNLGLPPTAAIVAGAAYMLSPLIVPYVSRTSLLLLPFAALGWLIGLTMRATQRGGWRDVAWIALILATVGAPNATALAMIVPGPVLWLLVASWQRRVAWRAAFVTAVKIGGAGLAVSLWWIAMVSTQGKYGADVLAYSETLEAVSFTATSPEVLRGLGYWLFYVRDPFGFATTASFDFMASGAVIAATWLLTLSSVAGLAFTRWRERTFAVALVAVGVVLAVGVHPIWDASPLMSLVADHSRSSIALALRSSTRAIPLSALGMSLGLGVLVTSSVSALAARARRVRPRWSTAKVGLGLELGGAAAAVLLVVAALPPWWKGGFVDPGLDHDEHPPAAWTDAAAALDASGSEARVMQLPGAEFGAFRWGATVDPPLPGLTDKPLITRDLLPLGSAGVMDLLYALDDRFQEGVAEHASIAPVARLLGVDTIWVPGDLAFDRYRTPRPEITSAFFAAASDGLGAPTAFGDPVVNAAVVPMIDEQQLTNPAVGTPVPPVELVPVEDPVPVVRAKTDSVVVAGSGDGLVDASAAGLLTGDELVRYAADLPADGLGPAVDAATTLIATDTNRPRAHHWRTSQDVTGFTEDGVTGVLEPTDLDQRLDVFPDQTLANQTLAEQRGPLVAAASAYGEPFAYRPEDRAVMAVDGDPSTAWVVGDRGDPLGEYLRVTAASPISSLRLVQPLDPTTNRWITAIDVSVDGADPVRVALDPTSRTEAGQQIALPALGKVVRLTIAEVAVGDRPSEPGLDAVGFAEVDAGTGPTEEVVVLPSDVLGAAPTEASLAIVLTRERVQGTDRWRADPEASLRRELTLANPQSFDVGLSARLASRAGDDVLAGVLDATTTATSRIAGVPAAGGWAATDGDVGSAWQSEFGAAPGVSLTVPLSDGIGGPLRLTQPVDGQHSLITSLTLTAGGATQTVDVPAPDADGTSVVDIAPMTGDALQVTVAGIAPSVTLDRRYGEPTWLPIAISELAASGIEPTTLPATLDSGCRDDLLTIDGTAVPVRMSGTTTDLLAGGAATVTFCGDPHIDLAAGTHEVRTAPGSTTGWDIDRLVLDGRDAAETTSDAVATVTSSSRTARTIEVSACPTGCWMVFGEGFNTGWTAKVDGRSLGQQEQVDGGFNGWWLEPSDQPRSVELTWGPQRTVDIALVLSAIAVLGSLAVLVFGRRVRMSAEAAVPRFDLPGVALARNQAIGVAVATTLLVGLVVGVSWMPIATVLGLAVVWTRRQWLLGAAAVGSIAWVATMMIWRVHADHPFVDATWPLQFEDLHRLGLFAVVALLGGALARER